MGNPNGGVRLNGRYYGYDASSYSENFPLKTSVQDAQMTRTVSAIGSSYGSFTLQLALHTTYDVKDVAGAGTTTWLGVSRLEDLKSFCGAQGVSLPISFLTPYGISYNVIPTGGLDIKQFNPENPGGMSLGIEFDVTLTLERVD